MQRELTQTRLDVLQAQLQPHFLFNTLNGIVTQIQNAPQKAEHMVEQLARILRFSLDNASGNTVSIGQELAILKDYLDIEKVRLGDRLDYQLSVDEDCMGLAIPTLILQPLVENSVRHGVAPFAKPGKVLVKASRQNGRVQIQIEDSGKGIQENEEQGIGLRNSRQRMEQLFGAQADLTVEQSSLGGAKVCLLLPEVNYVS